MAEKKSGTSDNKKRGKKGRDAFAVLAGGDLQPKLTAAKIEIRRFKNAIEQIRRIVS